MAISLHFIYYLQKRPYMFLFFNLFSKHFLLESKRLLRQVKTSFPKKLAFENGHHAKSAIDSTQMNVLKRSMRSFPHMELLCMELGGIQQLRGQNFAIVPPPCVDTFYTLSVDKNRHFFTPSPHLVHVVIEWPLSRFSMKSTFKN